VTAFGFSAAARRLADEARRRGLVVPGFRSPPRLPGAPRTLRRFRDGAAVVAVQRRGRAPHDVVTDMIEGVVVANHLRGPHADHLRRELNTAVEALPR
jgi:hypothetical protein